MARTVGKEWSGKGRRSAGGGGPPGGDVAGFGGGEAVVGAKGVGVGAGPLNGGGEIVEIGSGTGGDFEDRAGEIVEELVLAGLGEAVVARGEFVEEEGVEAGEHLILW